MEQEKTVQEMEQEKQAAGAVSTIQTVQQRYLAQRELLISLYQHPGWKVFLSYLKELDEALDIQLLVSVTLANEKLTTKVLGQRLLIRELLHMFETTKKEFAKDSGGVN